jgi:Right handed beta helix region
VKRIVMALVALLVLVVGLAGCVTSPSSTSTSSEPALPAAPPPDWDGTVGPRPVDPDCRGDADDPQPGDVICYTGDLDEPLHITVGGRPDAPIVYSGDGDTRVPGIRAEADHIVIQGFVSDGADSTGIWAAGTNVTVQDNTITQVRFTENDVDGIRFFGDGARVLHNAVEDLEGTEDVGESHVDCMQSFATSRAGSQNVVIQGNRCEGIRAQCLMAEGPGVADGSGRGVSRNWLFRGNYCDAYANAQSVAFVDVQDVTIADNEMAGKGNKAFALGKNSTGAVVKDNRVDDDYGREVGFDDPSAQQGYQGPPAR